MEPIWIKSKWKQVVRVTLRYLERDAQFAPDSSGRVGMWRWTSLRKTISVASHSSLFSALPPLRITRCCFIPLRWSGFFLRFLTTGSDYCYIFHCPPSPLSHIRHRKDVTRFLQIDHTFSERAIRCQNTIIIIHFILVKAVTPVAPSSFTETA